ncbi:unnamed protein product [Euphydryas editha]|uniref:Uncharacterized protein n=1 Tax=Euphydryas editha TaxID=104508 RepID=A0AAU9V2N9_EUPED|nr:unnamed protein product [Euphydryas editha]
MFHLYDDIYTQCFETSMPNQRYMADNLHSYVNAFSKTTVGYSPQFTANRKFFANMINTLAFKKMLTKDIKSLHQNILEKIQFCDQSVLTQDVLKQFYDREVDQTKL